jgi:hypothetical protein
MDFMNLPPELRLRIYNQIMKLADRPHRQGSGVAPRGSLFHDYIIIDIPPPTPATLRAFSAFLMSCKLIYPEFEHEAIKAVHSFLEAEVQPTWLSMPPQMPLVLPTPTRLKNTINMTFCIPMAYYKQPFQHTDGKHHHHQAILFHALLNTLSAFTLYPWSYLETDYAVYSNIFYNITRHLNYLLLSRDAEFTGKGLSPYDGYGRLWYDPPTMVVEWDACWDMRFTRYRTKG